MTFVEILGKPDQNHDKPKYMEAYIAVVEPERCGTLMKRLACDLPPKLTAASASTSENGSSRHHHVDFSHLKRVKRTIVKQTCVIKEVVDEDSAELTTLPKRRRSNADETIRLEIVLGAVSSLDAKFQDATVELQQTYDLRSIYKRSVPSRSAESEEEFKEFHSVWPIVYFANRTLECRERERQLSQEDIDMMISSMKAAIHDANEQVDGMTSKRRVGTVVVDPKTGRILARSSDERQLQTTSCGSSSNTISLNPLATSVLFAIQGVSRMERHHAMNHGMNSSTFQTGQYLCTGCDVYTTLEPTVYEAMALVHARVRRLVIGCRRRTLGNDAPGGLTDLSVHALPGTNHKYRAFVCDAESELAKACVQLRDCTK
ncbi:hypothetical protein MPSEU_000507700 [Mayamaea pseudoterrestris]|nr:hypothetical protein MPSEU_000507700 [Mayamaea pseudoterrestris]